MTEQKPENRSTWGHVIQYLDGYAWGIAVDGKPVCLGTEIAVKRAIANPDLKSHQPVIDQIIDMERNLKEHDYYGKLPELKKPGAFRSRTTRTFERRTPNIKQSPVRKRLPVH